MAALILDQPPPEKALYGRYRLERPYPSPMRSEPRYDFPTQPLLSPVPTIDANMPHAVC
jgi:hypothetical protein